ncbi:calcium-responsive transcription factor-like isoform X1 [Oratosquilla oratoria]|uniref:calcium-responsive transcription factor-like isoform X1 n=1 Tax=Oratosquilla oratoria TaxID=337810 RepID=UPI003F76BC13
MQSDAVHSYARDVPQTFDRTFVVRKFSTLSAALECVDQYQNDTLTRFVKYYKDKNFGNEDYVPDISRSRLYWSWCSEKTNQPVLPIQYDGVPFMHVGKQVLLCHQGRDLNKRHKEIYRQKQHFMQQHGTSRTRMRSQHSKKVDCPAAIHIAHIVKFPEFKVPDAYLLINSEPTEHTRKKIKKQLVDSYRDSAAGVALDVQFFVRLPDACAHHGHPVLSQSPKSKTKEPVDPKILELIHDLTQQGVTNIKVFQEHIASYVNNEVFKDEEPPPLMWRRYNPTEHDIRNAMYKVRRSMVKEKKRHLQNRCTSLLHDITQMVLDNDDEVYLEQLEEQLKNIHMSVQRALPPKEEEPHKHLVKKKCSESSGTHVCIKQEQSQEEHPEPEELTLTTYELTFDPSEPPQLETETEEVVTEVYYYEDPPLEYDFESVITES